MFKGFVQQADSFGSVKYSAEDFQKKAIGMKGVTPMTPICGCSALDWTGSFVLGASNLEVSRTHILPRERNFSKQNARPQASRFLLRGRGISMRRRT